jgi:outer membrane protein
MILRYSLPFIAGTLMLLWGTASATQSPPAPSKIGIAHFQNALLATKEGQAAAKALQSKAKSGEQQVAAEKAEISKLQEQLGKSANVTSREKQEEMQRTIEQRTRNLNRRIDDLRTELEEEQTRVINELGNRMVAVINKYAAEGTFALIVDIGGPQSPILYASPSLDVTSDLVKRFDGGSTPPAKGTPK